jgi:hypothetical protein
VGKIAAAPLPTRMLKLTRFGGHRHICGEGVHDGEIEAKIPT